jgi:hypothetical protein
MRLWLVIVASFGLAACTAPMKDLARLSDQDLPDNQRRADLSEAPAEAEARERGGLLGMLSNVTDTLSGGVSQDVITDEIAPGISVPYGSVARVCGMSAREMGKKIAQHPESRPRHIIYDSEPGNTAPHSFYVTGFDDGCARQFTASIAMFGPIALHEQLRYGLPAEVQPYSETDEAYETIKSRACGVPHGAPCGARLRRLERDTVFVSVYERLGSNSSWKNLLLHDGAVIAVDKKGG